MIQVDQLSSLRFGDIRIKSGSALSPGIASVASYFWQAPPLFPSYLSNGEVPGNAGSLRLPAAADSCKISVVVGAGGKFPGREKLGARNFPATHKTGGYPGRSRLFFFFVAFIFKTIRKTCFFFCCLFFFVAFFSRLLEKHGWFFFFCRLYFLLLLSPLFLNH